MKMSRPFAIIALIVALARPGAAAPPLEEARTRFAAGVQLFHEGSFDAALAEFRKAYQLAPSYRVLYNIAQVQFELHDYVEALKSFRQYLAEGGPEVPAERRAQVEGEVQKLERRVATLEIAAEVEGAEILIDDVPVGTTPLRSPIIVNAGSRRITATKPGRVTTARSLTVAGGDRVKVELKLPEAVSVRLVAQPVPVTQPVPAAPSAPVAAPRTRMWVALAATAALAVGAGTFALITRQDKLDFETQLDTFPSTPEAIDHARKQMARDAAITDGLAGASLLAAGLTLYFAVSHPAGEPEESPRRAQVRLAPTLGGLVIDGRF
jgi:hypothetical protein